MLGRRHHLKAITPLLLFKNSENSDKTAVVGCFGVCSILASWDFWGKLVNWLLIRCKKQQKQPGHNGVAGLI
jgi:hypothetical protein